MHKTRGSSHRGAWKLEAMLGVLIHKLYTKAQAYNCSKEGCLFPFCTALLTTPKWESNGKVPSSLGREFLPGCPFLPRNPKLRGNLTSQDLLPREEAQLGADSSKGSPLHPSRNRDLDAGAWPRGKHLGANVQ